MLTWAVQPEIATAAPPWGQGSGQSYPPQLPKQRSHLDTAPTKSCTVGPSACPGGAHLSQSAQQQEGSSTEPRRSSHSFT